MNKEIEEVSTGEVKTAGIGTTLIASALGSCVAVVVYDPRRQTGGIAHIMLPGSARNKSSPERFRYAEDAIEELLRQMNGLGSAPSDLCVVVAGGSNVLARPNETICDMNIRSALELLESKDLKIMARSLGGFKRRRIKFEIAVGCVSCASGDDPESILWMRG